MCSTPTTYPSTSGQFSLLSRSPMLFTRIISTQYYALLHVTYFLLQFSLLLLLSIFNTTIPKISTILKMLNRMMINSCRHTTFCVQKHCSSRILWLFTIPVVSAYYYYANQSFSLIMRIVTSWDVFQIISLFSLFISFAPLLFVFKAEVVIVVTKNCLNYNYYFSEVIYDTTLLLW